MSVLEYIVQQTNLYAQQCLGDNYSTWQQVSIEELEAYMEFMILMGLVKLHSVYAYWRNDSIFRYSPVASRISRKQFFEIHQCLHFVDNETLSPPGTATNDRLGKIRPILLLSSPPHMNLVPTFQRSCFKQYYASEACEKGFQNIGCRQTHQMAMLVNWKCTLAKRGQN